MGDEAKPPIKPIDGRYDFEIEGRGAGTGELRLTEYFNLMGGLASLFTERETRTDALLQFEIALKALDATREFLHRAMPGTEIETPILHLMTAMVALSDGKRPAMFSAFKASNGRDPLRVLLEIKVSACIDILHGPPRRMPMKDAARYVAKILEKSGVNFVSRNGVPVHKQILEWRKRLRAERSPDNDSYHATIARLRQADQPDHEAGVAMMLEDILAGAISPAHLNRDPDSAA